MNQIHVLGEPTLEHTDVKIIAWLLSCVVVGIIISILAGDFDDDKINGSSRRTRTETSRTWRQVRPGGRRRTEELVESN